MKITAVLGPPFSFTDLAFRKFLGKRSHPLYVQSIPEVFSAVMNGRAEKGIVPLRNSIFGKIRASETKLRKLRKEKKIRIEKIAAMKISHVLAVLPNTREQDIDVIMTNRIIFSQCRKFLKKHFPKAKKIFSKTSSAAAEFLAKRKKQGMAVIVPKRAAKHHDLKILKTRIEDSSANFTEFVIFKRAPVG